MRVLFVPDSIFWVTGTLAKSFAANNPSIEATIISGAVLPSALKLQPDLIHRVDLVHFTCTYASREWLPVFRSEVPCVTSHHHVTSWELQRHNVDGDAVIVSSSQWAEDARDRGIPESHVVTVPYGVDTEFFSPPTAAQRTLSRKRLGFAQDTTVIGFFAKHSSNEQDRKGTDVFLEAARQMAAAVPNVSLLIVGPGWSEMVSTLRAEDVNCVWIPFAADAREMRSMYWALDFYWITARVEGGPVPLLEAMSCGVACVSTAVGLAREVVRDGENAASIPMNDPTAVVGATSGLIADPARMRALSHAARETMVREMDSRLVSRRVLKAYDVARAHFRERGGPKSIRRSLRPFPAENDPDDIPRAACSPAVRQEIASHERLAWAQALHIGGQRREAWKLLGSAWFARPNSSLPLRYAARLALPRWLLLGVLRLTKFGRQTKHLKA